MGKISEVWMDDEIRLDMTNMNGGEVLFVKKTLSNFDSLDLDLGKQYKTKNRAIIKKTRLLLLPIVTTGKQLQDELHKFQKL